MWSDPIDNALAQLQTLLDQLGSSVPPTADQIWRARSVAADARDVRAFEWRGQRLITPEDHL